MELLTSRQTSPTAIGHFEPQAALSISTEGWAVAIQQKYGTAENLIRRWAPAQQRYCALNFAQAFRTDELPETVVRVTRTFGDDAAQTLLKNQLTDAIIRAEADRDISPEDINAVAQAICDSERLRRLALVSVLKFFHRLRCGEYEQLMYGRELTARKILTEMNRQFPRLIDEEAAARKAYEKEKADREAEEHRSQAVTWEQWAEANGLDDQEKKLGFYGYAQLQEQRRQLAIATARAFADFAANLIYVLAFLADPLSYLNDECTELLPFDAQNRPVRPQTPKTNNYTTEAQNGQQRPTQSQIEPL